MFDAIKEWFSNIMGEHAPVDQAQQHIEDMKQGVDDAAQNVSQVAGDVGQQAAQKAEDVKNNLPGQQ